MPHTTLFDEGDGGTKSTELLQVRHVDAIVVGVANLWRTAHHYYLPRMQAVEYLEDAFLQSSAPNNAVVNDDKVVFEWPQGAVGDVIDMRGKVVARACFRDEGSQFDVLPCHLLAPYV